MAGHVDAAEAELRGGGGAALSRPLGRNILAGIMMKRQLYPDAIELLDKAIGEDPASTDSYFQRGVARGELGLFEEAVADFDRVVALRPGSAEALINRAIPLAELARFSEALASLDEAAVLKPADTQLRFRRGTLRLLLGDYSNGWGDFEARWARSDVTTPFRQFRVAPDWTGENLVGKRILVLSEQGLGDTIQFARFLSEPAFAEARITVQAPSRMRWVLRRLAPNAEVVEWLPSGVRFDAQVGLMSIPGVLRTAIHQVPPVWHGEPDVERERAWRARIGEHGFRIGICWQGNPAGRVDRGRSPPLLEFEPLSRLPGVRLISLQKEFGVEHVAAAAGRVKVETYPGLDEGADAFADTAAILAGLDLVVSCDTSIAHLAGTMGRPTWLAIKNVPNWRWHIGRDDSPWYPRVKLFRQASRGDWRSVFVAMAGAVAARL